jgi:polyisoprenoid-binding protein YceI
MPWTVDRSQSKCEFLARHLRLTTVRGRFSSFEGKLEMDEQNPQASQVAGSVAMPSVDTRLGVRDANLRSRSFFDVKKYPKMSFRSTRIGPFEGHKFQVFGDLTIRDITRPVVFDVVDKGESKVASGRRRRAFEASLTLNRKDFGLRWNALLELGGIFVADKVKAILEIQFVEE